MARNPNRLVETRDRNVIHSDMESKYLMIPKYRRQRLDWLGRRPVRPLPVIAHLLTYGRE